MLLCTVKVITRSVSSLSLDPTRLDMVKWMCSGHSVISSLWQIMVWSWKTNFQFQKVNPNNQIDCVLNEEKRSILLRSRCILLHLPRRGRGLCYCYIINSKNLCWFWYCFSKLLLCADLHCTKIMKSRCGPLLVTRANIHYNEFPSWI